MKKQHKEIAADTLRSHPGFEHLNEKEAQKATQDIKALTRAIFKQMIRTRDKNPERKAA